LAAEIFVPWNSVDDQTTNKGAEGKELEIKDFKKLSKKALW
jgi:hypothetical protein